MRKRYVGIPGGGWAELGEPETSDGVMIMPDIEPYQNMVDGQMITSRSQHREFLKKHNLVEVGNEVKAHLDQVKRKDIPRDPRLKQRLIEIAAEKLRY